MFTVLPTSSPPAAVAAEADDESPLAAVAQIADILAAGAARSDAQGWLADESVKALQAHGLWRMRLCRELGGLELSIVSQIRVLAALAAQDTSSAWCTMVANSSVAVLGATMPPAAVERIFAHGVPACSIVAAPGGVATPAAGGYLLNGVWRLASSVHHAEWIHAAAHIEGDPSRLLTLALPARDIEVLDSWHVVGLAGTGSNDFRLTDYFLPTALAGPPDHPYGQLRGTRRYDLVDLVHLESYEHLAFALGVGRRALGELEHAFAVGGRSHTADREVVQTQVGRALVTLQAIEAMAVSLYTRVDAAAAGQQQAWDDADRQLPRALAVWATECALEFVQMAFQRSGAVALHQPNIMEKLLRDMSVAATHAVVNDTAYAAYAHHLIESHGTGRRRGALSHAD
jgi:indole-3-acetate monooxygenase